MLRRLASGAAAGAVLHALLSGRARLPRTPRHDEGRLLALVATGAAVEELFWHGPVFRALSRRVGAPAATGATSPAFALWHQTRDRTDAARLTAIAAAFAVVAVLGGWVSAAAAHVAYDLLVVLEIGDER